MSLLSRVRKQWAVYWPPEETTDRHGRPRVGSPRAVRVRWSDRQVEFIGGSAERMLSNSVVLSGEPLALRGMLWLGAIQDAPGDPFADKAAFEIRGTAAIPNFRATEFLYRSYL